MHAQQCHTVGQDQNFSKPKSIVALLYHWGDPLMQKSHNRCISQFFESIVLFMWSIFCCNRNCNRNFQLCLFLIFASSFINRYSVISIKRTVVKQYSSLILRSNSSFNRNVWKIFETVLLIETILLSEYTVISIKSAVRC